MIAIMYFTIINVFIGPLLVKPFLSDHPDMCIVGFLVGFTISILLWMKYGRKMQNKFIY